MNNKNISDIIFYLKMSKTQIELMQDMSILRSEIHSFDETSEKTIFEKSQLVNKYLENFLVTNANIINKCENDTFSSEYNDITIIFINLIIELKKLYYVYDTFEDIDSDDIEEKFNELFEKLNNVKIPEFVEDNDETSSLRSKFNALTSRYITLSSTHKELLNKLKHGNQNSSPNKREQSSFEMENKLLNETVIRLKEKIIDSNKVIDDLKVENEILNEKLYKIKDKSLDEETVNYNVFSSGKILETNLESIEEESVLSTTSTESDEVETIESLKIENDTLRFNLEKMKQLVNICLKL